MSRFDQAVAEAMDAARTGRVAEMRTLSGAPLPGDDQLIQAGAAAEAGLNSLGMTSRSRFGTLLAEPRRIA